MHTGDPNSGRTGGNPALRPESDSRGSRRTGTLIERIAGWSIRHRWTAICAWLALVMVSLLISSVSTGRDARSLDPGEAGRAEQVMAKQNDGLDPPRESVLIQPLTPDGPSFLKAPQTHGAAKDLVAELQKISGVTDVSSPLDRGRQNRVSTDGRSGLVSFTLAGPIKEINTQFLDASRAVEQVAKRYPQLRIVEAGDKSLTSTVDEAIKKDMTRSEGLSLPITLLILLAVFGSLIAAGIPLLLAGTTVAATFGFLGAISKLIPVNSAASVMILLIGMAVGIDYSLFYLRREREERAAGHSTTTALLISARTSGHAVVVSGLTVMLCVAGLLFTGMDVFRGLTVGAVLVVGLAVTGSVTVLPALLALLGHRIDRGRVPWLGRRRTMARESRFWSTVANRVVRRPLVWGLSGCAVLGVMALPAFGMHLQDPATTDSLPRSVAQVDAAVRMQQAFPGAATPSRVAIWSKSGGNPNTPELRAAIDRLRSEVADSDGRLNGPVSVSDVGNAVVVRVPLAGNGTGPASMHALEYLRNKVLPATIRTVDGIDSAVSGKPTAQAYDFAKQLESRTVAVFAFILSLAFIVFIIAFRSLAIPIVSIVLNLLSIGAAYGLMTWVFQDGHFEGLLGFTSYGGVVGWLPLFMFVMLFGLSMDYHIFILSRIRERWLGGTSTNSAIVGGIRSSAGVVSSAALIMTAVFAVFVTLSAIEYKMLGLGMAAAVLIDATVVRGVLLPSALALLGERSWWMPGRRSPRRHALPYGSDTGPRKQATDTGASATSA